MGTSTGESRWIDRLIDWTDAWIRRGVTEPDGYLGWPKVGAAGTDVDNLDGFYADSLLGEAMVLRPVVLAAAAILTDPTLADRRPKGARLPGIARRTFAKWDRRGAWRAPRYRHDYGRAAVWHRHLDGPMGRAGSQRTTRTSASPTRTIRPTWSRCGCWRWPMRPTIRSTAIAPPPGFVMKSRLRLQPDGTYQIWSYWAPAGPWDYRFLGVPKHWIGVHPNDGYYATDVRAIVAAYEHGLVFSGDDLGHLIKTAQVDGRGWPALAPYDATIRAGSNRR